MKKQDYFLKKDLNSDGGNFLTITKVKSCGMQVIFCSDGSLVAERSIGEISRIKYLVKSLSTQYIEGKNFQ